MAVMVVARLAVVLDISSEVCCHKLFDISAAAADDLDALCLKNILGSLAHVSGQHDSHSHLAEHRSDSALASASFRRSHLADSDNLTVNDVKYCIVCAMTEVVIHASVSCRYCYLHVYWFCITFHLKRHTPSA